MTHRNRSALAVRLLTVSLLLLLAFGQVYAAGSKEAAPANDAAPAESTAVVAPAATPAAVPAATPAAVPAQPRVRLATTTSTENSGLLDFLLPEFTKDTGYTVDVIAVGTGAALKLGENADADVLLVHARSLEDAFMAASHGSERRDVMYNDFVIIGPKADPAGLSAVADATAAFARLASTSTAFVSRGDNSGTHVMEKSLWKRAAVEPAAATYKEAGQGMEQVIIMADGLQAYTLTDRATWLAVQDKTSLTICFEGDPVLFNPYGVITVNPAKHEDINADGAKALLDWLTSGRGQTLIPGFKIGANQLFFASYKE